MMNLVEHADRLRSIPRMVLEVRELKLRNWTLNPTIHPEAPSGQFGSVAGLTPLVELIFVSGQFADACVVGKLGIATDKCDRPTIFSHLACSRECSVDPG